jgi:AraC-like DNA-binding protein
MKMTNTLCSTSCSSYSEQPEPGFYLCTIKAGETFVIEPDETNRLVFLRSGRFVVSSVEEADYQVSSNSVIFCARSHSYTIVAQEDCALLVARFVTGSIAVEGETYRTIASEVAKITYKFAAVPVNEVLGGLVDSVSFYLEQGINTKSLHRAKIEEMFVIFRHFYSREVYLRTFYSLFNNNMSFRTLVENNAPNARNVEHLAKMCGHSLSHFKLLFSQNFDTTPYVWMQRNRAVEISELLSDTSIPIKSIIKKYGFTSHGHFSLFRRKFLGDTPRTLRRRSHLSTTTVTLDDVKKNFEHSRRQAMAAKKSVSPDAAPRRRGRPRKNEVK